MKLGWPGSYTISLTVGMVLGLTFGDYLFTGFEEVLGKPLDDIVMALGGAVVAGIVHELVTVLFRKKGPTGPAP